jgi:hypothetical protein
MRACLTTDIKESILAETVVVLGNQIKTLFEEKKNFELAIEIIIPKHPMIVWLHLVTRATFLL